MKTQFQTKHVLAKDLMEDDRFKMGGMMYRVREVYKDSRKRRMIHFYPTEAGLTFKMSFMLVPKNTRFKIYNQK